MKIGIDISQIVYKGTGSARYNAGMLDSILKYDTENSWTFFFSALRRNLDTNLHKQLSKRHYQLKKYPLSPKMLDLLWNKLHLININSLIGDQDWVITSDWTQPPANSCLATLVHDLAYKRFPEVVPEQIRKVQEQRLNWAKKESSLFLALSKATKQDLMELMNIPPEKIKVLYPGIEIPTVEQKDSNETLKRLQLSKPFILSVGKIEPRKNIGRLIQAFSQLHLDTVKLVIVGPEGWDTIDQKAHPNIKFTGYLSDTELFALYRACLFFVMPSVWEGFGYPVIEAMMSGAAVATSNTSSLKEISEGAAILFNPLEIDDISATLKKLLENEKLRADLSAKGLKHSAQFSPENYYNNLITILQDTPKKT